MIQSIPTQRSVRSLTIIFDSHAKDVKDYEGLLNRFPYNIQKYIDQIAETNWKYQNQIVVVDIETMQQKFGQLDTADCHHLYFLKDSSKLMREAIKSKQLGRILKGYKTDSDAVLFAICEQSIHNQLGSAFISSFPSSILLVSSSESDDNQTGYVQEQWNIMGQCTATLNIERTDNNQILTEFSTKQIKLRVIIRNNEFICFEVQDDYSTSMCKIVKDNEISLMDKYRSPIAQGRFNRTAQTYEYGYVHKLDSQGVFVHDDKLMMGTINKEGVYFQQRVCRQCVKMDRYPQNTQEEVLEIACPPNLKDQTQGMQIVSFQKDKCIGIVYDYDGKKIQGYFDQKYQPILTVSFNKDGLSIDQEKLAKQVYFKRHIFTIEVGQSNVNHMEKSFLTNVVQLCDKIGLPFIQGLNYQVEHISIKEDQVFITVSNVIDRMVKGDVCHIIIHEGDNAISECIKFFMQTPTKQYTSVLSDLRINQISTKLEAQLIDIISQRQSQNCEIFFIQRSKEKTNKETKFTIKASYWIQFDVCLSICGIDGILVLANPCIEAIIRDNRVVSSQIVHHHHLSKVDLN